MDVKKYEIVIFSCKLRYSTSLSFLLELLSELTNLKSEEEIHGNESNVLLSTNWAFFLVLLLFSEHKTDVNLKFQKFKNVIFCFTNLLVRAYLLYKLAIFKKFD